MSKLLSNEFDIQSKSFEAKLLAAKTLAILPQLYIFCTRGFSPFYFNSVRRLFQYDIFKKFTAHEAYQAWQ